MKISWQGFAGKNHSWAFVAQNICRELDKLGHQVHMNSTNGLEYFPDGLRHLLKEKLDNDYDLELSYTAMKNFSAYLNNSKKSKKFGIWCFEWFGKNSLPTGFAKHYKDVDKILAPSKFSRRVFIENNIPENAICVIPHGYDDVALNSAVPYNFNTKKIKIFLNVGQIHMRKGMWDTLDAFGSAFTKKDDVIFIMKVADKPVQQPFEISFSDLFSRFKSKYPNHAEIKIIKEYVPNIYSLYKSCDIHFNMTRAEGFGLPFLEAAVSGLINVVPYDVDGNEENGYNMGMCDFCNKNNSLMVEAKAENADPRSLYYEHKFNTKWIVSKKENAVEQLKYAVNNVDKLKEKFNEENNKIKKEYTWSNVSKKIINLYESIK